jgi:hypothetical protein
MATTGENTTIRSHKSKDNDGEGAEGTIRSSGDDVPSEDAMNVSSATTLPEVAGTVAGNSGKRFSTSTIKE